MPIQIQPARPLAVPAGLGASAGGSAGDPRHHLARDQLHLAPFVTHRPEMDPLAAGPGIGGQQFRALVRRADADPPAKLRRVPPEQRANDLGQDPFRVGADR